MTFSPREGTLIAAILDVAAARWWTQAEDEHRALLDKHMIATLTAMATDIRTQLAADGTGQ